jgi:prepilin-type N-terminal cleavage/methylation domain-containing protein
MKIKQANKLNKQRGFTIIEIMLVLAIAALIMVVVLIAAQQLQKNRRNAERKSYVNSLLESEEEYLKSNSKFPACDSGRRPCTASDIADAARFISVYMPDGTDPITGKSYKGMGTVTGANANGSFVKSDTNAAFYFYNAGDVNHNMKPSPGQIFIAVGHYCYGNGPVQAGDGPLSGPDIDYSRIVILVGLENGGFYCVDNNGT